MKRHAIGCFLVLAAAGATAKLPPLTDDAKAKAAETAARTAWTGKVGDYQLCKVQDQVAAQYLAVARQADKPATPTTTPPCADPGPFVYAPADAAKPIEASGAHSPPQTATAPPSTNTPAAATTPTPKK